MTEFSKEHLFHKLRAIANQWHEGTRQGNDGNQGNTLEDLLGVPENNVSLPDFGEIELKTRKVETGSLLTLFHKEPLPAASVPKLLLSLGWKHRKAGKGYPADEMSFRQTTPSCRFTNRGFTVKLCQDRITLNFDPTQVKQDDKDITGAYKNIGLWLNDVQSRSTPHYADVLPVYWERAAFEQTCIKKLEHTLFVTCSTRTRNGKKYFYYNSAYLFSGFNKDKLGGLFSKGGVYIDFDARTRHNHGTKLRINPKLLIDVFDNGEEVF